ncbi:MAG: CocE/NonD family hydrolase [Planctomycetota bacterium]
MKLNPLAGLLSLLVLACTSGLMLAQEATTTTYTGTLSVFGNKLRLEVDMTKRGDNLTGALRSLDQGNVPLTTEKNVLTESELKFAVPKIGAQYAGTVFEDGKTVEGKFTQNGMKFELKLTKGKTGKAKAPDRIVLKEAWVGELNLGIMKPVMQFRIVTKNGNPALLFDSITEGVRGIEGTYTNDGSKMTFEVKAIKLKYEGELDDTGQMATGTWKQGGRELPLELKRQLTEYSSKNVWKNRPQRPKGPFPYDAQDVVFENKKAEVKLAGTLTIPKSDGKVPAVILISGSGPQDRDETLMEHKPFLVLADYLSRRGIAVLRYDDRGTNQSTGKFSTANTQDLATDAAAAIDFLKSNDRIDATKIGLAGHSEGGLIAPIVATDRDDVAFTVLMAGTGITGSEIITSQSEAMLRATDVPEDEIKLAVRLNRAAVEIALKNDDEESITSELKKAFA